MATTHGRYFTGIICGTGATLTVPAQSRGGRLIARLISCLRVTLVEGTPNTFSCAVQGVIENGARTTTAPGAGNVRLNAGTPNQIVLGTALLATEFLHIEFESDSTGLAAVPPP